MSQPYNSDNVAEILSGLGIARYQSFSESEAAKVLGLTRKELMSICDSGQISYLQLTQTRIGFFGFQLAEYLLSVTFKAKAQTSVVFENSDRILRIKEVVKLTGLSRSTIWRYEQQEGAFPERVSLGVGSVGWRESDIQEWIKSRQ